MVKVYFLDHKLWDEIPNFQLHKSANQFIKYKITKMIMRFKFWKLLSCFFFFFQQHLEVKSSSSLMF